MVLSQLCLPNSPSGGNPLTFKRNYGQRRSPRKLPSSVLVSNTYPIWPLPSASSDQSESVAAIIFGDGSESQSRLYPLTKRRSEGALPMAANYRLIDAVVSNCINSNIKKIFALTQFNSTSLNSHLSKAYCGVGLGIVQVIAAHQSPHHHHGNGSWFQGTADAVRKCLWILEEYHPVTEFVVLPGHHLYRMDYQQLVQAHRNSKADITIAASTCSITGAHDPGFGILQLDSQHQVSAIRFKSAHGKLGDVGCGELPSMGIYVVNKEAMRRLLEEQFPEAKDLAREVIAGAVEDIGMKVQGYAFGGRWEEMRSIGEFYKANMESIQEEKMGYRGVPVYTMAHCLPPTLISEAVITNSLVGDGCILGRCSIRGSVIGMRTRIGDGVLIEDSVIIGSDGYQDQEEEAMIPVGIGQQCQIRKAIVDKNARIGNNVMIINKDKVEEGEGEEGQGGYVIREGIVVVPRNAVIPHGTIL